MGGALSSSSSSGAAAARKAGNAASITAIDRAVLDLKNSRDRLQRYRARLEQDEAKLLSRAREAKAAGNEKNAMHCLRVRRHKVKEADNVQAQLLTVLQMVDTIAAKENENEVLASLKSGKEALARLHSEMSVDDVIQLMEEVEDEIEVEREINDILAQGAGLDGLDEEALEQELLELVGGEVEVQEKAKVPDMPAAPTDKLPDASVPEVALEEKEKGPARVAVAS